MKHLKALYIQPRFFYACTGFMGLFVLSFIVPSILFVIVFLMVIFVILTGIDGFLIFSKRNGILATRILPEKFSNGDHNTILLNVQNQFSFATSLEIIDEVPVQFQIRDFKITSQLLPQKHKQFDYTLRPTTRGMCHFGALNIYVTSPLGLVARRFCFDTEAALPTYPSFIQLKKYNLLNFNSKTTFLGIKKIRRLGHTMEFEQIKDYVLGDDLRTINWKATAKKNQLMINQFQDEKSQPIYTVIDKGRLMKMPFSGMTLLDHAINTALVITSAVLKNQDKAGVLTFSRKIENHIVAERRSNQMQLILENLYRVTTDFSESDFGQLYVDIKRQIPQRSLLFLYTNFETVAGLQRQLPYLKGIAKQHVLVIVFFKNTALNRLVTEPANTVKQAYDKVIAEKFIFEKRLIVSELKKNGLYVLLTNTEHLTTDSINQYLEIKARGLL